MVGRGAGTRAGGSREKTRTKKKWVKPVQGVINSKMKQKRGDNAILQCYLLTDWLTDWLTYLLTYLLT